MSFIGVICENKNENYIKQVLNKQLKKETIITFNQENIENLKNIKFETILIISNNDKVLSKREPLKNIIEKADYLIINADEEINFDLLKNVNANVITYGFNSKSTITASSVKEDNVLLCIQRGIQNLNQKEIEQQEISIQKNSFRTTTNTMMGVAAILLLYGINEINV